MRRPGARSLDLPRLPPLQVRLCGPALPPPPDTRPLRTGTGLRRQALLFKATASVPPGKEGPKTAALLRWRLGQGPGAQVKEARRLHPSSLLRPLFSKRWPGQRRGGTADGSTALQPPLLALGLVEPLRRLSCSSLHRRQLWANPTT
ncbi:hypothetical protein CB1_001533109 [Camelus ferus]|nr:hypothetical protein CB1_001533109 [Camelus ferus]